MNVLVLESESGAADRAIAALEQGGHTVLRCHDPHRPAFPCKGVETDACPVAHGDVDVALTVRATPGSRRALLEDGITCALRARIPLVVAGQVGMNPYENYAAEVIDHGDVVGACAAVLARPSEGHTRVASEALRKALAQHAEAAGGSAVVHRRGSGLHVELIVPEGVERDVVELAAAQVMVALRAYDENAASIDIASVPVTR